MTNILTHPSGVLLLDELKVLFASDDIKIKPDRHIIFVCGGPVKAKSRSMRYKFIKYAKKELSTYRFLLVESAMKDLSDYMAEPEFINIATFEELVADLCDCLLIFPESPGSIAELAYFANSDTVRKMLVVNDVKLQEESFINLGPIDKINKASPFKPTLIIDYKKTVPDFSSIRGKLSKLPSKYRKKLELKKDGSIVLNSMLYVIYQIVNIFLYISLDAILACIKKLFGSGNEDNTRFLLSILIAANYVKRVGDDNDLFSVVSNAESFLDFKGRSLDDTKASVILFYQKYYPEIYKLIGGSE